MAIKASINLKLSSNLKNVFPDVVPVTIPELKDRKIHNYNWIAGFTDAEGCFFFL